MTNWERAYANDICMSCGTVLEEATREHFTRGATGEPIIGVSFSCTACAATYVRHYPRSYAIIQVELGQAPLKASAQL